MCLKCLVLKPETLFGEFCPVPACFSQPLDDGVFHGCVCVCDVFVECAMIFCVADKYVIKRMHCAEN